MIFDSKQGAIRLTNASVIGTGLVFCPRGLTDIARSGERLGPDSPKTRSILAFIR